MTDKLNDQVNSLPSKIEILKFACSKAWELVRNLPPSEKEKLLAILRKYC